MHVKKIIQAICVMSALSTSAFAFESTEHMLIGNKVKLYSPDGTSYTSLPLSNGLNLTYGEILALGGDYFAINELPISQGESIEERKIRFINTFETLASSPEAPGLALQLIASFKETLEEIEAGQKEGKSASEIYDEIGGSLLEKYNMLTGGGSIFSPMFPLGSATLQLLSDANWDHFAPHALLAYQAGHLVAIDKAIQAGKMADTNALAHAYAMNAFAGHYLSDTFSAGHMRTPRKELTQHVESTTVAALLMDYMHGEDSKNGLKVSNLNGDEWTAYGDGYYLETKNQASSTILDAIMQLSADEIYYAYLHGKDPSSDELSAEISNLLPQFTQLTNDDSHLNTSPLFVWDEEKSTLLCRKDINDPHSYEWTSSWWGWTTLVDLGEYYAPRSPRQRVLHTLE